MLNIEQAIREYLPGVVHMSLATSKDNKPWVCEVHFAYDQELNIYFRSLASRRHSQEIAQNPYVAGNIVEQHELGQKVRGVYFEGKAHRVPEEEIEPTFRILQKRLSLPEEALVEAKSPEGHQIYSFS